MTQKPWITRVGKAYDRFLNVLLLDGDEDETISYHAAVEDEKKVFGYCVLCRFLELVQPNHCKDQLKGIPATTRAQVIIGLLFVSSTVGVVWGGIDIVRWITKLLGGLL